MDYKCLWWNIKKNEDIYTVPGAKLAPGLHVQTSDWEMQNYSGALFIEENGNLGVKSAVWQTNAVS